MKKSKNKSNRIAKSDNSKIISIASRYSILILLGLGNLFIFYKTFTPITIAFVSSLISIFYKTNIIGSRIIFNSTTIELIPACIAGSAYYLLLILNLSTPNIKITKRITAIILSFVILLLFNSLRIFTLSLFSNSYYFNQIHMFFWYFLTTVFVMLIWIITIKIFKIKSIPFYSDISYFYNVKK